MTASNSRFKKRYEQDVIKKLSNELGIKNKFAIPRIEKIIVNSGVGDATGDKSILKQMSQDLAAITGQKPSVRRAKVSVASFGVRHGMPVGLKVTLRGIRMYDFLDRLFSIVLPRLRDFRGLPLSSFDKFGNYTIGIREHSVFPEIDLAKSKPRGLEITIVTSTDNPKEAEMLLRLVGLPFQKPE
jgi:large subunit ribosomal protein L5